MDRYIAIDLKVDVLIHYAKNGVLDIAVENNHYAYMAHTCKIVDAQHLYKFQPFPNRLIHSLINVKLRIPYPLNCIVCYSLIGPSDQSKCIKGVD